MIGVIKDGYVLPEWSGQGFIFKDDDAFENNEGICYVAENDYDNEDRNEYDYCRIITSYTREDLLKLVETFMENDKYIDKVEFSAEDLVKHLYESLDWQTPTTEVEQWTTYGTFDKI